MSDVVQYKLIPAHRERQVGECGVCAPVRAGTTSPPPRELCTLPIDHELEHLGSLGSVWERHSTDAPAEQEPPWMTPRHLMDGLLKEARREQQRHGHVLHTSQALIDAVEALLTQREEWKDRACYLSRDVLSIYSKGQPVHDVEARGVAEKSLADASSMRLRRAPSWPSEPTQFNHDCGDPRCTDPDHLSVGPMSDA